MVHEEVVSRRRLREFDQQFRSTLHQDDVLPARQMIGRRLVVQGKDRLSRKALGRSDDGATRSLAASLGAAVRRLILALPAISSARASFTLASMALPVNALIETGREPGCKIPSQRRPF